MSKTITIRLPDDIYKQIAAVAKAKHTPISSFILHATMNTIADMFTVDNKEMKEIFADKELMEDLRIGHQQVKEGKVRIVR